MNKWQAHIDALSWEDFDLVIDAVAHRAVERPAPVKVFSGEESAGHDTHAAKAIKAARKR